MNKWDLKSEWKKVIFAIVAISVLLILDLKNGSSLRLIEIPSPQCLAANLFDLSILILLLSLFAKKEYRRIALKWGLIIIIPSILAIAIEDKIVKNQYAKTTNSLEEICLALNSFKDKNGAYPNSLEELQPTYLKKIPNSGFGLFDSKIKYELLQNDETSLTYKVKFGFICEAYNCEGRGINYSTWARC